MKIRIERNGVIVKCELDKDLCKDSAMTLFNSLYELTNSVVSEDKKIVSKSTKKNLTTEKSSETKKTVVSERPVFRDRLPNNVVDINTLDVKQAVTENTLVRCPHCGQSHALIVHSSGRMYMMRKNYKKKEFVSIAEWSQDDTETMLNSCCKEDTDKQAYYYDLQNVSENTKIGDFFVNNETEIFCPVCNTSNNFLQWKDAYENPLNFFETEQLCDACGGEVVEKIIKGKTFKICDVCGLEKEV